MTNRSNLLIGPAQQLGPLQVWPLEWENLPVQEFEAPPFMKHLNFNEFDEGDGPTVDRIEVENPRNVPFIIPSGWILGGDLLQVRTVDSMEYIRPNSFSVINVSCVERGRWAAGSTSVNGGRAPLTVMATGWEFDESKGFWEMDKSSRASRVWQQVSRQESRTGSSRPTSSLKQIMEEDEKSEQIQSEISWAIETQLRIHPNQNGALISAEGSPLIMEFFSNPKAIKGTLKETIRAASFDVQIMKSDSMLRSEVERFIEEIRRMKIATTASKSWGYEMRVGTESLDTFMAVNRSERVLHLSTLNRGHRLLQGV